MKAAVCYGNGVVKYEDVPTPSPQAYEVRVKIKACGICKSDVPRALKNTAHYYPIILGHECAGVIDKIGDGVEDLKIGDRVCVIPLRPCFNCLRCKEGNYALCHQYSFIGSRQQGGMAEYVVVPAINVYKLTANISFEQGALFEAATVALHAYYQNNYKPGGTVAILGGGTIGMFALQWAKILGCKKVIVFGRDKNHLNLALELGADAIISTEDSHFKQQALELTNNQGFDYIFETAGTVDTIKYSFELAAPKSYVCLIGTPTREVVFSVRDWEQLNRKEFHLTGSWMSYSAPFPGLEWKMTEKYFANGKLKFDDKMFFNKYPLKQAQEAFNLFTNKNTKVRGRVLLQI